MVEELICDICEKKFTSIIPTEKLCPKCKKKYGTKRYYGKSIKEFINWDEWNKKEE